MTAKSFGGLSRLRDVESPTIFLAAIIYGGWAAATWFHASIPIWLLVPIGGWFTAWHGSLQHETIHSHPTQSRLLNSLIGGLPLTLWLPYRCYRRDHLQHHTAETVTYPMQDPESRYLAPSGGLTGHIRGTMARVQASLFGHLILGPPIIIGTFLFGEMRRLWLSPIEVLHDWASHLAGAALVGAWLLSCHISLIVYLTAFIYPGMALTLLRSFAEHRAAPLPGHRVAIIEGGGALALLFLNNNLHAAHHRAPGLPWFRLPAFYRRHRREIIDDNGGLWYGSYGEIARRFGFRAHDVVIHPHLP